MTKLNDYAWKWRVMDSNLGFREGELNHFQAGTQHQDAPNCYLRTMLSQWFQWAPGDNRGSSSFATLQALKDALSKSGLGTNAFDLSLQPDYS